MGAMSSASVRWLWQPLAFIQPRACAEPPALFNGREEGAFFAGVACALCAVSEERARTGSR
jgi:hypothetical protein